MMKIQSVRASILRIPFKVSFKHASAEREATQSLWVELRAADGTVGIGEGCPRDYVTGETPHTALAFVERHSMDWPAAIQDLDSLRDWVARNAPAIDANPAAWSAVELAMLDAIGKESGRVLEELLDVPSLSGPFRYTAVIGDGSSRSFDAQLGGYVKAGFKTFKIKLSGDAERDHSKVAALSAAGVAAESVRADANNLWTEASGAIRHLEALDFPFVALEEPLSANDVEGMRAVARARNARIILDESCLRIGQLESFAPDAHRWIVNVRVSKMGGLVRSLELVKRARALGLGVVVGAHVGETSVLSRAALCVAEAAGACLVAQEGAFGTHLLQSDPVSPCWMFGAGGRLDLENYRPLGAGLGCEALARN